jgi:hypothetical protein
MRSAATGASQEKLGAREAAYLWPRAAWLVLRHEEGRASRTFSVVFVPVGLGVVGILPGGGPAHPFAILTHDGLMSQAWTIASALAIL